MRRKKMLLWMLFGLVLCFAGRETGTVAVDGLVQIADAPKYIALTFDDGPRPGTTDRLLDGLRERGASATFFLVGEQAQAYPDLVQRMSRERHQVGNHTWSHVRLEGAGADIIRQEVEQTENLLQQLLGGHGYWLRPPYGQISPGDESLIPTPMIKWSVDPRDWESRDQKKIVEAVLAEAKPNSIILLHDIYATSVEAALEIVDKLSAEGYWFVTVEDLLAINGITPEPGNLYRTGSG